MKAPRRLPPVLSVLALAVLAAACDAGRSRTSDGSECPGLCPYSPEGEAPEGSPVARHGQLAVEGTRLVDTTGAPVQLKGVSSMWLNWEYEGYAESRDALEWLRDNWNVEVIRASMGIEPAGAYLDDPERATAQVQRIVRHAIDLGLYVIVDWHDHDAPAHQAEAQAFFAELAEHYGGFPNVIYEPYNEPLRVSWTEEVKPYHEAIVDTVRAIDPDNVVVLGTPQWSQLVDEAALDPVAGTNLMYTLHFYACEHTQGLRDGADAALALGLPIFVTEWGATDADGGVADRRVCTDEAELWHAWMNEHEISWAAWKLDACVDASCLFRGGAPIDGPFGDDQIQGHAALVRAKLLE